VDIGKILLGGPCEDLAHVAQRSVCVCGMLTLVRGVPRGMTVEKLSATGRNPPSQAPNLAVFVNPLQSRDEPIMRLAALRASVKGRGWRWWWGGENWAGTQNVIANKEEPITNAPNLETREKNILRKAGHAHVWEKAVGRGKANGTTAIPQ
jgi:hypothetical protein